MEEKDKKEEVEKEKKDEKEEKTEKKDNEEEGKEEAKLDFVSGLPYRGRSPSVAVLMSEIH